MNYTLAKQLKDAGFTQDIKSITPFYFNDMRIEINPKNLGEGCEYPKQLLTKIPTLEELIDACGDRFGNMILRKDGVWEVCCSKLDQWAILKEGKTPQIALSKLWLALNK